MAEKEPTLEREQEKKIVLEIGSGLRPQFLDEHQIIPEDTHYVAMDLPTSIEVGGEVSQAVADIKKKAEEEGLLKGQFDFMYANAEQIPMADGSVDSVIARKVIGAPPRYFKYRTKSHRWSDYTRLPLFRQRTEWISEICPGFLDKIIEVIDKKKNLDITSRDLSSIAINKKEKELLNYKNTILGKIGDTPDEIESFVAKAKMVAEMCRVLKVGGIVEFSDNDEDVYSRFSGDENWYDMLAEDVRFELVRREKKANLLSIELRKKDISETDGEAANQEFLKKLGVIQEEKN